MQNRSPADKYPYNRNDNFHVPDKLFLSTGVGANRADDNISVIRTYDNTVVETESVSKSPSALCSIPSGEYVYVSNYGDESVSVFR